MYIARSSQTSLRFHDILNEPLRSSTYRPYPVLDQSSTRSRHNSDGQGNPSPHNSNSHHRVIGRGCWLSMQRSKLRTMVKPIQVVYYPRSDKSTLPYVKLKLGSWKPPYLFSHTMNVLCSSQTSPILSLKAPTCKNTRQLPATGRNPWTLLSALPR